MKHKNIAGLIFSMVMLAAFHASADDTGWTPLIPTPDTRIVYVSRAIGSGCRSYAATEVGSDPFMPSMAVQTCPSLNVAQNLVRSGHADWVLLKRGEQWDGYSVTWTKSGAPNAPMVIATYGGKGIPNRRPLFQRLASYQAPIFAGNNVHHLAVTDLDMTNLDASAPQTSAMEFLGSDDLLIEGNRFDGFSLSVGVQAAPLYMASGYSFRRNVVAIGTGLRPTGIYVANGDFGPTYYIDHLSFEGNIIYKKNTSGQAPSNFMEHSIYVLAYTQTDLRENFFLQGAGIDKVGQFGTVDGNVFVRNTGLAGGCSGTVVANNLVMDTKMYADYPSAYIGISLGADHCQIHHNLVTRPRLSNDVTPYVEVYGMKISGSTNMVLANVVNNWCTSNSSYAAAVLLSGTNSLVQSNELQQACATPIYASNSRGSYFTHNSYYSTHPYPLANLNFNTWVKLAPEADAQFGLLNYRDPQRDVATYVGHGYGSDDGYMAFEAEVAKQSKFSWNENFTAKALNAHIRAGFAH